jgi:hypothetical protein
MKLAIFQAYFDMSLTLHSYIVIAIIPDYFNLRLTYTEILSRNHHTFFRLDIKHCIQNKINL